MSVERAAEPENIQQKPSDVISQAGTERMLDDTGGAKGVVSSTSVYDAGKIVTEIRVSLMELNMIKCPKIHGAFMMNIRNVFGIDRYMRKAVFECRDKQLFNCCLKGIKDKHELHKSRIMGMRIINDIILRASPTYITPAHVLNLVWSCLSCIHHFQLRIRSGSSGIVRRTRMRQVQQCMETYSRLIRMFDPSMHRVVLSCILTFYKGGKMWIYEFAITDVILDLLTIHQDVDQALNYILSTTMEVASDNYLEGRYMFKLLYYILKKLEWYSVPNELMEKLLGMFESSISPSSSNSINYAPLRKSLELCIKNAIKNCGNQRLMDVTEMCLRRMNTEELQDEALLEIGHIASYAAGKFKVESFPKSITPTLLADLNELAKNKKLIGLLITIRIWKNLIDRNKNERLFKTPRIFFQDCDYKLIIRKCSRADKQFFKSLRPMMYDLSLQGFILAECKWHLDLLYQVAALTLVEMPCGYTASTHVAVIMNLQDYAFKISSTNLLKSHYLHAIVMSIMSLIGYVHNAQILYKYVTDIMDRRAEWAPHLNPPLLHRYQYAEHHILWNKPNLFFEDWEAGYGLWKCFREKKKSKKFQFK